MEKTQYILTSILISQINGIQAGLRLALAASTVPEAEEIQSRTLVF
jgi:hypothetical protein